MLLFLDSASLGLPLPLPGRWPADLVLALPPADYWVSAALRVAWLAELVAVPIVLVRLVERLESIVLRVAWLVEPALVVPRIVAPSADLPEQLTFSRIQSLKAAAGKQRTLTPGQKHSLAKLARAGLPRAVLRDKAQGQSRQFGGSENYPPDKTSGKYAPRPQPKYQFRYP